jgi:hypothetical protein
MLRRVACAAFVLLTLGLPTLRASAQRCVSPTDRTDMPGANRYCGVDLIGGLGGTAGFGDNMSCLSQNDDGSSPRIDITRAFPRGLRFFTTTHTSVYVNTNGNITFSGPLSTYTPRAFPVASQPMIAPYWADVDIRMADGRCQEPGATTCTSCTPCYATAANQVWWYLEPGRAIFTWDEVGYYNCHDDRRMSFQLILTAAPGCADEGDFDVEFRYNRCEWETGDASGGSGGFGGTPAQAGFDAGNSRDFVEIMGSRMPGIARRLCEESNVGEPGIWRFQIRSGVVMCPDAGMPCRVPGQLGVCAEGRTNCVGRTTECVQQVMPSPERCDALDNDCDGVVDDMDSGPLCPALQMCVRGTCTETCFEGGCPDGFTCTSMGCVETACADVICRDGERCRGGVCVPACDGIVCPYGQSCVGGRCVDACAGITCDDCTVCESGACVARCMFAPCGAGQTCTPEGRCVETACVGVTCGAGSHCRSGACVDSCEGARCPPGEICELGACVPAPPPPDAGPPPRPDGGIASEDAGGEDIDAGGSEDIDAGEGGMRRPPPRRGGCCSVGPGAERGGARGALLALALLALAVASRRR